MLLTLRRLFLPQIHATTTNNIRTVSVSFRHRRRCALFWLLLGSTPSCSLSFSNSNTNYYHATTTTTNNNSMPSSSSSVIERSADGTITVSPKNEADQSALVVISHGLGDTAEGFADVAEVSASGAVQCNAMRCSAMRCYHTTIESINIHANTKFK